MQRKSPWIPVVDLFAGPGGLNEGFSSFRSKKGTCFHSVLSVEKDTVAHRTLLLRSFFRKFEKTPKEYYARIRGEISTDTLFKLYPDQAKQAKTEAQCLKLGRRNYPKVERLISKALRGRRDKWVLIGGPPCQAYSLAGRSRMRSSDPDEFEQDHRHFLYREYLRILKRYQPPVFVMENVKGILSSTVKNKHIFRKIRKDLENAGYTIHSFTRLHTDSEPEPEDFIIQAEEFGIPQTRHRVVLLGIRNDLERRNRVLRRNPDQVSVKDAIGDLPKIRSAISKVKSTFKNWTKAIAGLKRMQLRSVLRTVLHQHVTKLKNLPCGAEFLKISTQAQTSAWLRQKQNWFLDKNIGGVTHHAARSHMGGDLKRYLFAASYTKLYRVSPKISEFPVSLWPDHENIEDAADGTMFADRFRVQRANKPATTIVSHLRKDGHYFIHYDPVQCRSLTVREAARLQTFPDNYFFEGNRTQQYEQVGNAVPPLLAKQLAAIVHDVLEQL
jgi:DNA (cytosine-5)-methyltransferase 1